MDASHDYWSGLNFTYAMKNNNISGYFGGNSVFNTYAGGGAAPNGTVITLEMSSLTERRFAGILFPMAAPYKHGEQAVTMQRGMGVREEDANRSHGALEGTPRWKI